MPNGPKKKLNFVAKVWDEKANSYRPLYIAPDATASVQGDVYLSDSVSDTKDAASGMTAATPKAVKAVQDNANNKLDKTSTGEQTVAGRVTFSQKPTFSEGATIPAGKSLSGNASTASALQTSRKINVKIGNATVGTAGFNGSSDVTISVPQVDASVVTTGTLPINVVPQAALERLVKVENKTKRFALTQNEVQLGDSVLQLDTGVMYIVVDASSLGAESGYQEYKAGTAANVAWSGVTDKPATFTPSAHTHTSADISGTIPTDKIADGAITDSKTNFNYAGSSSKGGAANSAVKLSSAKTFSMTGNVTASAVSFNGTQNVSFTTTIATGAVSEAKIAAGAVSSEKLASSAVTTTKIADSAVTGAKIEAATIATRNISDAAVTAAKIANLAISAAKLADGSVTTTKIAQKAITNEKLAEDVGTVFVGADKPTDDHVKIWVKV